MRNLKTQQQLQRYQIGSTYQHKMLERFLKTLHNLSKTEEIK